MGRKKIIKSLKAYRKGLAAFQAKAASFCLYSHHNRNLRHTSGPSVWLHHDLDKYVNRLKIICDAEQEYHVRSNIMVLRERPQGQVHCIDWDIILDLQEKGFLIGYHTNAYERAGFNLDKANQIFEDDVLFMRNEIGLDIQFYSAHGSTRDAEGRSDIDFRLEAAVALCLESIDDIRFDMNIPAKWIEQKGIDIDSIAKASGNITIRIGNHPQYWIGT